MTKKAQKAAKRSRAARNPMEPTDPMTGLPRCTATNRAGQRCKKAPIPGGAVCVMHGGGAPQVQQAAKLRLAALVDPAITRLGELLKQKKNDKVALGAVKDILDRAGHKPSAKVDPTDEGGLMISWASE